MFNYLIPLAMKLRGRFPRLYYLLLRLGKRYFGERLGAYPRMLGDEIEAVSEVLKSSQWNMAYGRGLVHERLEADFASYVGVDQAVAVGSGGVALQMSMRAMGFRPGDEILHQVDTCSAVALASLNAGVTPIFVDLADRGFMLDWESVESSIGPSTRGIIGTHMWGNPEDMPRLAALAAQKGLLLIEDACLALGAKVHGRPAGSWGNAAVFSFGCIKPIQAGEGGMIVTNDTNLARELRALRHWGDRTIEFGLRDVHQLAWNGRMSEIVAAVVREQLKGYPAHLATMRNRVSEFADFLSGIEGLRLVLGTDLSIENCAFTQVVVQLDTAVAGIKKDDLWSKLTERGIPVWHANFEPINSLTFFHNSAWREWVLRGDIERVGRNYSSGFPAAQRIYRELGFGLGKMNFMSDENFQRLKASISEIVG